MNRSPVGHHQAVETPFLAQYLGQEPVVLGRVDVVDPVVRAHQRRRTRPFDYSFEYAEVDFPQGAFVDPRVCAHSIGFLVVGGEMLHGGPDPSGLDARGQGGGQFSRQQGVLREVLEVPPAQRGAFQVHARPQDHADALRLRLLGQRPADLGEQRHVPGGRERRGRGETCGRYRFLQAHLVGALGLFAQPVGAVGDHQGGNPESLDRLGVPEIAAGEQRTLFLEGELREELGDLFFGEHSDSNPDRYGPEYGMVWLNGRRRGGASRCSARLSPNRSYNYIMFLIGHLGRWEENAEPHARQPVFPRCSVLVPDGRAS